MWRCPRCQELIRDDFSLCWNCGSNPQGNVPPSVAAKFADVHESRRSARSGKDEHALRITPVETSLLVISILMIWLALVFLDVVMWYFVLPVAIGLVLAVIATVLTRWLWQKSEEQAKSED